MRTLLVLSTLAACAFPASAIADTITVVPEPAGANCATGGVKITVTPTPPAPPAPPPADQISYVCSGPAGTTGAPGADGQDGAPGADGEDGRDGLDGQDGRDGSDGADGLDGSDGSNGTTASRTSASCGAASTTLKLPARFKKAATVTEIIGGRSDSVPVRSRSVKVNLRGLSCGTWPVVVTRRGIKPFFAVYSLGSGGSVARIASG